jgi:integrase
MPRLTRPRRKITDAWVRQLAKQRPALVTLHWDVHPNLALQQQPSGALAWKFIFRFHGRPRWLTMGDALAVPADDARRLAATFAGQVAAGVDPQAEKMAARAAGSFEELRKAYLEQHAKKRNKSWRQGKKLVDGYLAPAWDKLKPSQIARADARAIFRSLSDRPSLANQVIAAGSAIFSWALREECGGVKVNPFAGIERNQTRERERILSDEELPRFWAALDDVDPVKARALRVLLLLGQRPGEIACMRREHLKGAWWEMPGEPVEKLGWPGTKNADSHRVHLTTEVFALLGEDEAGFVFASGSGQSVGPLDDAMRDVSAALGLGEDDKITPHDLRRTFGSTVTGLGFSRDDMDRILNHKKPGIANVYDQHRYAKEDARIMQACGAHLLALADGKPAPGNVVPLQKRA